MTYAEAAKHIVDLLARVEALEAALDGIVKKCDNLTGGYHAVRIAREALGAGGGIGQGPTTGGNT